MYFVQADLTARRLVRLMPEVPLLSDAFRLVWRSGHVREQALMELAAALRRFELR